MQKTTDYGCYHFRDLWQLIHADEFFLIRQTFDIKGLGTFAIYILDTTGNIQTGVANSIRSTNQQVVYRGNDMDFYDRWDNQRSSHQSSSRYEA